MILTSISGLDYVTGAGRRLGTTTGPRDAARVFHALIDQFTTRGGSDGVYVGEPLSDAHPSRRCRRRKGTTRVWGQSDGDVGNGRR